MKYINFCMKYDTCKRCPLNQRCEAEIKKQEKEVQKKKEEAKKKQGSIL